MKLKRILALAAVILLLGLYAATFIFALGKSEHAGALFRASLVCTVLIPIFCYAMLLVFRLLKRRAAPTVGTVIFDLGHVLIDFPWQDKARSLGISEEAIAAFAENCVEHNEWHDLDLAVRPFGDIVNELAARVPEYESGFRLLMDHIYESLAAFPYAEGWVKGLKEAGYKVYVLSNWAEKGFEECEKNGSFGFLKYTDGQVFSYRVKLKKPDPEIFKLLLEKYSLNAGECVYIDDTPANVKAARQLGIPSFAFTSYEDACEKLKSLGVRF